jgi:hypothetical protein
MLRPDDDRRGFVGSSSWNGKGRGELAAASVAARHRDRRDAGKDDETARRTPERHAGRGGRVELVAVGGCGLHELIVLCSTGAVRGEKSRLGLVLRSLAAIRTL